MVRISLALLVLALASLAGEEQAPTRTQQRLMPPAQVQGSVPAELLAALARGLSKGEALLRLDGNGDGQWSLSELAPALKGWAPALVELGDTDQDGFLSRGEWDVLAARPTAREDRQALIVGSGPGRIRSHLFVGEEQAFIVDYDATSGQLDLKVQRLRSGTVIDVADPVVTDGD
jgi:hypothetical protein